MYFILLFTYVFFVTKRTYRGNNFSIQIYPIDYLFLVLGEFLEMRQWKGLQQNLGDTPVTKAVEGQTGIAMEYNSEPSKTS